MTTKGYVHDVYKQFEELNENNKKLTKELEKANKKVQELLLENERLKNNNDKDSSNYSKPSSTNGYKKVIINNRQKSGKNR